MSIFDRGPRGNVQSPFSKSSADAFSSQYANPRMPQAFQGSVGLALNYLFDATFPDYKGTVATPSALPITANANDWYLVTDDGDGKSAGYVWTVTSSGGSWVKRYDVDWSYEQILADTVNRSSYMYAAKYGMSDKDAFGTVVTGLYAGQRFYGGDSTGQNLTLTATRYDSTGFIQTDNTFRPTATNAYDVGTSALSFRSGYFSSSIQVGSLALSSGSISDSSGAISFGSANIATSGQASAATFKAGTLTLGPGSIADSGGSISFGSNSLTTNGTITGATGSKLADITFSNGTFSTTTAAGFSFSNLNLQSINQLTSSKVITTEVDSGNLILSGNTLTTNSGATALILQSGSGGNATQVQFNSKSVFNFDASVSGILTVGGSGNSTFTGPVKVGSALTVSTVSTTATLTASGQLNLVSSGVIQGTGSIVPEADATRTLGTSSLRYTTAYLSGGLSDGTNTVSTQSLLSLRNLTTGAQDKYIVYYDAASSTFKTENANGVIDHLQLLNLTTGDAGHTQFAMLAGRSGGQTLFGDTAASGNLILGSTANATKGLILVQDTLAPNADATYSAGWSGVNLGGVSRNFNNMYSKGIHYGLRFDQYAGSTNYPASSGQNVGRVIWDTALNQLLVDTGSAFAKVGSQKVAQDLSFDGTQTSQTVTVSSSVSDARTTLWQLLDNTNGFEQLFCKITKTQTSITITTSPALPAGTYRLLGIN